MRWVPLAQREPCRRSDGSCHRCPARDRIRTGLAVGTSGRQSRGDVHWTPGPIVGGLMFMYGEAGAKRQISGIVFGGGLALFAAQFLVWLF